MFFAHHSLTAQQCTDITISYTHTHTQSQLRHTTYTANNVNVVIVSPYAVNTIAEEDATEMCETLLHEHISFTLLSNGIKGAVGEI